MIVVHAGSVAGGHSGVVHRRTGPEASDFALFIVAGVALWIVRRALRRRFARTGEMSAED
ncbi:hypothetical protein LPN01_16305 [Sphingomonas sp. A2-49]|uniref:hypothetical protein n=1 Tax=Sphingomonas sp. A2-49 TaxID=1391375 RepID=UPI0021D203F9|nr:hypothetical protein [Sphingomonas sp. A2-49]MCU6455643.1 hypothetical protein [Sphingomonas sp. A2-49]